MLTAHGFIGGVHAQLLANVTKGQDVESYDTRDHQLPLLEETIGANFERTVKTFGEREALVEAVSGRRWTWSELNTAVDEVARGMLAMGIERGDRVGIWAPNCGEWIMVQIATAKIGAILVTINPAYSAPEFRYAVNKSGVRLLIAATGFKSSDYQATVSQVSGECPSLERSVFIGTDDWSALIEGGRGLPTSLVAARMAVAAPDDAINIQYTSGTTGAPKGATLNHRNILNNGYFTTELIRLTEDDRLCIPVPFYHCFGMVLGTLGCITHGTAMIIPGPGFDADATLRTIETERCTGVYGVPTMFIAMLNDPGFDNFDLTSLRTGIMAGSPCPVEVMKRCIEDMHMSEISIAYGMTETAPISCQTLADDDLERRTGTIGRVHPHVEIKIADPKTGKPVPRGQAGEFCTRGYSIMIGYWEDPAKTEEAIDKDGWMHTGDLAVMREDGYCQIVGRLKDMVIRGGENIYPREIEEFFYTHPDVQDVQVVGVPDDRFGEELCAWIKMRPGAAPLDADALKVFAAGKLAHYKVPRYVMVVDAFPMTVTGKIRKVEMRERSIAQLHLN